MKELSFLHRLAAEIIALPAGTTLVVLPTRRGAADLRSIVARMHGKAARLPMIMGVSDYNDRISPLPVAEKNVLLLNLYKAWRANDSEESLTSFLGWGEQLLKDFNEIDLQMLPADKLFQRITEFEAIEEKFAPEEERENFRAFWNDLSQKEISPLKRSFLSYWERLPLVYHDFRKTLAAQHIAYEGMALRQVAEMNELPSWIEACTHIVYAGFYALNRVEEVMLEKFEEQKKLLLFKDSDNWYVDNPRFEAGMFFRKGRMAAAGIPWQFNLLKEHPRGIEINGISGGTGMAREIAHKLAEQLQSHPESATDTVVILPDEGLLFSLLNFCQSLAVPVNPSMGFPVIQHPLWQVVETIRLIRTTFPKGNDPSIPIRKKELLFENHYIHALLDGKEELQWPEVFRELLNAEKNNPETEAGLLNDVLHAVIASVSGFAAQANSFFITETENANAQLIAFRHDLNSDSWWKLMTETLQPVRIPFKADREKGVHIMGFLETRVLDFSHVYIASMNEGVFPAGSTSASLVPYVIRKHFNLPCREEQEAVTAYHFFRLLQRASHLNLYYDNSPDAMGGGEMSRYLLQLYHELIPASGNKASYKQVINQPAPVKGHVISIPKDQRVMDALRKRYIENDKGDFSASAIIQYISCPVRFYLDQLAGLRPPDAVTDALEANVMGLVLHGAMQNLYTGYSEITSALIDQLYDRTEDAVLESVAKHYRPGPLFGHDLLMKEVIIKLVHRILESDRNDAPFRIFGLEKELKRTIQIDGVTIKLKGYIDRVDIRNEIMRVLDYKTGKTPAALPKDRSRIFSDPEHKVTFQLLMYLYLIQEEKTTAKAIAGIFPLSQEKQFVFLKGDDEELLKETEFEARLIHIIREIFDTSTPFSQTNDIRRCEFCDFAGMCRRN